MTGFLVALALVLAGGLLPLLLGRQFLLLRLAGAGGIAAGSALGCADAARTLLAGGTESATFPYLRSFELGLSVDPLGAFFLVVIFGVSALAALYSFHYMDDGRRAARTGAHYLCFSFLVVAMALVVAADDMVAFLIAWELMTLSSFFLVVYDYEREANRRAAYQYFVFSHVGAMFIFAAFGVIFAGTGSLGFDGAAGLSDGAKILVFVLALVGFGSKAGVFPIHFWLPHAHPAAPSHISALMSGVMIKTGIFAIVKIVGVLQHGTALFGQILLTLGVVSGVLGVVYALGQRDLKRLLAYSSVENIGIVLIGLGIGLIGAAKGSPLMAALGFAGGLLHVLNHACFKSLLFLGAGMVLHQTGTRAIDRLGGLLRRMRVTGATFLIGSLAIAGLPPLNGFVGEILIYLGGFQGVPTDRTTFALSLLAILGLAVIGGLALACFTRVVGVAFQGEPRSEEARAAGEHGWTMLAAMVVLASACVTIGVLPGWVVPRALDAAAATGLTTGSAAIEPLLELSWSITTMALVVLGGVVALALVRWVLYRGKTVGSSGTWGCGYTQPTARMQYTGTSYAAQILELFGATAPVRESQRRIEGRFPEPTHYRSHVEDVAEANSERLVVRPVMAVFDKLRWIQHGDIHLYIGYILLAIVILLVFVWRG